MTTRTITFQASALLAVILFGSFAGFCEEDWFEKGLALTKARQYDEAVKAFTEAIDMIPGDFQAYNHRGIARAYQKDYDGAIQDYTMALQIKPGYAEALNNRGFAWVRKGNLEKALADFSRAIELEPAFLDAYISKAWILATSSDERYRDGKQAVKLAKQAVDIDATIDSLDAMSAAYAANGQFNEAVANQKKVIELVVRQNRTDEMDFYLDHLINYKAHKPLRISYATAKKPGKKPLAVQVGLADSYKDAREFKSRLRDKGYMAYSLLDRNGRKKTRVLIGAYGSKMEAMQLMEQLQKDGFTTQILTR